jgi:hypothetical protein
MRLKDIKSAKVGDELFIRTSYRMQRDEVAITKVAHATATFVIDSSGRKWNRETAERMPRSSAAHGPTVVAICLADDELRDVVKTYLHAARCRHRFITERWYDQHTDEDIIRLWEDQAEIIQRRGKR